MNKFGHTIRQCREAKGLLLRQLAVTIEVDSAMMSKIERGERNAKRQHVKVLAEELGLNQRKLLILWLADKIYNIVKDEDVASEALKIAEEEINYQINPNKTK